MCPRQGRHFGGRWLHNAGPARMMCPRPAEDRRPATGSKPATRRSTPREGDQQATAVEGPSPESKSGASSTALPDRWRAGLRHRLILASIPALLPAEGRTAGHLNTSGTARRCAPSGRCTAARVVAGGATRAVGRRRHAGPIPRRRGCGHRAPLTRDTSTTGVTICSHPIALVRRAASGATTVLDSDLFGRLCKVLGLIASVLAIVVHLGLIG